MTAFVMVRLARLLRRLRPDVLQTFTFGPNLVGAWVARLRPSVVLISSVTGLGRAFSDEPRHRVRTLVVRQVTRLSLRRASRVMFQHPDDRAEYLSHGLCTPAQAALIVSSGVDLRAFDPAQVTARQREELREAWGLGPSEVVVTMISRLLPEKGVREFAAAARALRGQARFLLIGPVEHGGKHSVTAEELELWQREDILLAPGYQRDVVRCLGISDVFALPSYYREGVPRTNLEAMAMGLPVVTTDAPGCRETVVPGENGFLVPPRDAGALIDAFHALVEDRDLRSRMGRRSRVVAEQRFDAQAVVRQYLDMYVDVVGG